MEEKKSLPKHLSLKIEEDLRKRVSGMRRNHHTAIADLCACALITRSCNTAEWMELLPRIHDIQAKSKERFISRTLSNPLIKVKDVMKNFIHELVSKIHRCGKKVILMMDQSQISSCGYECLMISIRIKNRAAPILWKVVQTKGPIGFDIQKELLDEVLECIPDGVKPMLLADRFYGTSALVAWCVQSQWMYRIRLKGNLIFHQEQGDEITPHDALALGIKYLENVMFHNTTIKTNIGIIHEKGHKEPWYIAGDDVESSHKVLDYGMRWGIECMFSDFKSKGFSITKTHLVHEDRMERLLMILALASYWAISFGMGACSSRTKPRSNLSLFKKGLRTILPILFHYLTIPDLWHYANSVGW